MVRVVAGVKSGAGLFLGFIGRRFGVRVFVNVVLLVFVRGLV